MDINELLGKATKAIGKIKGVGNDSTGELVSKAKKFVANTKPIKSASSEEESVSLDEIVEGHNKNNPWHIVDVNTETPKKESNSPFKYSEVELEKIKNNSINDKDEDVDNLINLIGNVAHWWYESVKWLIPLAERMVAKVAAKKVSPEVVNKIMDKDFDENTNIGKSLNQEFSRYTKEAPSVNFTPSENNIDAIMRNLQYKIDNTEDEDELARLNDIFVSVMKNPKMKGFLDKHTSLRNSLD